jgi:predicted sulfurtransferase
MVPEVCTIAAAVAPLEFMWRPSGRSNNMPVTTRSQRVPSHVNDVGIPIIDSHELVEKIDSVLRDAKFERVLVIDCRNPYEYEGGHIRDAVNYSDKESLRTWLSQSIRLRRRKAHVVLYCEHGLQRSLEM